ncbi:MAG: menaquinol oxidoreductase [Thermodesulfatator sp.]|nr:MAG: menaquinol oxidoreductase [Thermodesulfatator sp.]
MIEKALKGSSVYWGWVIFLLCIIGAGFLAYLYQLKVGLGVTGMSRDISWGVYIAQFTYFVGVAAGAVMLVIPKYLHHYTKYAKVVVFGEFIAIAAVIMCLLFIVVDIGQPMRMMNVVIHPTPHSMLFYDMIVLNGYLLINIICGYNTLLADKKGLPCPGWVKPVIYLSIPWAISIHTVTAFLYAGLPGRHFWLTAIMAPRFLASAFAAGPSLLVMLLLFLRKYTKFDAGQDALQNIARTICYAMIVNFFFMGMEFFTAFYSNIPGHKATLEYLFWGIGEYGNLVPFMRACIVIGFAGIFILLVPSIRRKPLWLAIGCACVFLATWIDKGVGLVIGGFIPSPLEVITEYHPTFPEITIATAIWAVGGLVLTILYKVAVTVREEEQIV